MFAGNIRNRMKVSRRWRDDSLVRRVFSCVLVGSTLRLVKADAVDGTEACSCFIFVDVRSKAVVWTSIPSSWLKRSQSPQDSC